MTIHGSQLQIAPKNPCRVATTANIADLAAGAPDPVDTISLSVGDRVLVKDQSTGAQNGIYQVDTVGSGSNGAWSRTEDFDSSTPDKVTGGVTTYIQEGSANEKITYTLTTTGVITVGSTSLTFEERDNVSTSAALTDDAILRGDGGGSGIQDTGVTIDDNDNIIGAEGMIIAEKLVPLSPGAGAGNYYVTNSVPTMPTFVDDEDNVLRMWGGVVKAVSLSTTTSSGSLTRGQTVAILTFTNVIYELTLPPASEMKGTTVRVIHSGSGTNTVTIVGDSGETINGAASYVSPLSSIVLLVSNGTLWLASTTAFSAGIVGDVGSVDGGIPRADGTAGNTVQSSGIVIDDSDNMTLPASAVINLNVSGGALNLTSTSFIDGDSTNGRIGLQSAGDIYIRDGSSVEYARFDSSAKQLVLNGAGGSTAVLDARGGDIEIDSGERFRWDSLNFIQGGATSSLGGVFRQRGNGTGVTSRIVISPGVTARDFVFEPDGDLTFADAANMRLQWRTNTSRTYIEGNTGTGDTTFATDDLLDLRPDTDLTISPNGTTVLTIGTSGHLVPGSDDAYDLGESGGNRFRDLYLGSKIDSSSALNFDFSGTTAATLGTAGSWFLAEQAAAIADVAAFGQFWVESSTPNVPKFTDDAGTDFDLVTTTASVSGTEVPRWVGTSGRLATSGVLIDNSDNITGVAALTTSGDITTSAGNIGVTSGTITASGDITSSAGDVIATAGNLILTATNSEIAWSAAGSAPSIAADTGASGDMTYNSQNAHSFEKDGSEILQISGDTAVLLDGGVSDFRSSIAQSSGGLGTAAQTRAVVLSRVTTDDSITELHIDGSASATQVMVILADTTWLYEVYVAARRTDVDGESAGYIFRGVIANDSGTTALVGSTTSVYENEDTAAWIVDVTAVDATTDYLRIRVTGEVDKTIQWTAFVRLVEAANG